MDTMKNALLASAWRSNQAARNHKNTFHTDGKKLYSYSLCIGDTCESTGKKILKDYTAKGHWGFRSMTTSQHVGLARMAADIIS